MSDVPLIGITMGDPAGIGPEIIVKALADKEIYAFCQPLVLGDPEVLSSALPMAAQEMSLNIITTPSEARAVPGEIDLVAVSNLEGDTIRPGKPTVEGGKAMVKYIFRAVEMIQKGKLGAMVTCPISKVLMHQAGYPYDGHTQLISHLTNTDEYIMMLAGKRLRVALVTIHCPLKEVPAILNTDMVYKTITITARALLEDFGLENARLAVAALNPHASESGLFGSEEEAIITPAINKAKKEGYNLVGPLPSDTLFYKAASGQFDAVVAMYHDQGLIPLKLLHFSDAVNVTLGLPIVRTSVDHGTAYDIAGTGMADASSLKAAIKLAATMVQNRRKRDNDRRRKKEGAIFSHPKLSTTMPTDFIRIKGARQHNLKNISIDIPRNQLVVITGLSGSGKSSLAFDTIYAEGQRRYVESLSAYARQFLEQMEKPDVDSIEGLSPAISIEQRTSSKNPRSTVGTVTEVYDYFRVMFARIGQPHCPKCDLPISSQTTQQIVDQIMQLKEGHRIQILAPLVAGRKGEHIQLLQRLRKDGFTRVKIDGEIMLLEEDIVLSKNRKHVISVVVDRLIIKKEIQRRLTDSVELALSVSDGGLVLDVIGSEEIFFNKKAACSECGLSIPELIPQMFSFNNPQGACTECSGLGLKKYLDPDLIVPDPGISLREGAVAPWANRHSVYFQQMLDSLCRHYGIDVYSPFREHPKKVQEAFLYGSGREEIKFYFEREDRRYFHSRPFEGVVPNLERRFHETDSYQVLDDIGSYMSVMPCPLCKGARLNPISLAVRVGGKTINEISELPIEKAHKFFNKLKLGAREKIVAQRILKEIRDRLGFLMSVGLGYLTIDRSSATLSGGEAQRIRLATQISSGLAGVLYVLDEPSIGLHQRDNLRLLENLKRLRDLDNTVLVVEHDTETILSADHVIDMGPGAGRNGGHVVFQGSAKELICDHASLTGQYLAGKKSILIPKSRRKGNGKAIVIDGAKENNLKDILVEIPLGTFTCVTGVSGSGKSSLINGILYPALSQKLYRSKNRVGRVASVKGIHHVDKALNIDQSPIGRTPRSNPATYTGVFTHIRELFSMLPESRIRGYKPGRFSFNVKGGRCEACKGDGIIKIEMHFLPDVYVKCDACKGLRYNRDTLEVKYRGHTIADILDMTVNQAFSFFEAIPAIKNKLKTLVDVGLGYIKLGQQATTLSGGEAQRIKLSKELSKRNTGKTLYLLDEPTTGLHFADIQKLLEVLNYLVEVNNTVVVIEHNLEVIKTADYIIDLGPEGGDEGGYVVGTGTPERISENRKSYTGQFLKKILFREVTK